MKGSIRIEADLCKGCKYCIIACPKQVLALDGKFNKSGYFPAVAEGVEDCTGCALCAHVCPEIAIEVWRESGDPGARD